VIELTEQEREELTRWSTSRTLAAGDVFKAKLILALSDGVSYSRIEVELKTSRPTIARWKARFEEGRIAGLEGRHKGSRPRAATPAMQARVLKKTQQKPPDGSTHWSCRKMAAATGLSPATVHRIWSKTRLKPHRLDRYMASNDPAFEQKAADIIGLYLDPPQHAACSAWTKKLPFRHWIASIQCCPCLRDGPSAMDSSTTGTALYLCMRRSM
jgi:hypothetical protein